MSGCARLHKTPCAVITKINICYANVCYVVCALLYCFLGDSVIRFQIRMLESVIL
jgi:hypothetical protein